MRALVFAAFLLLSAPAAAEPALQYEAYIKVTMSDGTVQVLKWTPGGHPHFFADKAACEETIQGNGADGAAFAASIQSLVPQIAALAQQDPKLAVGLGCVASDPDGPGNSI